MSEYDIEIGQLGAKGESGNSIIIKTNVAPGAEDGAVGDICLRYNDDGTTQLYGPKTGAGWPGTPRELKGPAGDVGDRGWSPLLATIEDVDALVIQIFDWIGGVGTKPAGSGWYLGPDGLVEDITDATHYGYSNSAQSTTFDNDVAGLPGNPATVQAAIEALHTNAAWEFIGSASPNGDAQVDFTDLGDFRLLRIVGWARPSVDGAGFTLRYSTDNGATVASGASEYQQTRLFSNGTSVTSSTTVASYARLDADIGVGNAATELIDFEVNLSQFNKGTALLGAASAFARNNNGTIYHCNVDFDTVGMTARNAIRLAFATGSIAAGFFMLEGVRG